MNVPIWTLEARSNVMLDVIGDYLALTPLQMQTTILEAHRTTIDLLAEKDVDYRALRNALTPQRDKYELALLFDSTATGNDFWYGLPVYERLLAAIPRKDFTCALLAGDLLINDQDYGFDLLQREAILHRPVREFSYTNEIYGIYINNLSKSRASALREQFEAWEGYIGYLDCSYSSPAKDWMSTTLGTRYIKRNSVFIGGHEDDADPDEDRNLPGRPLEDFDYTLRSIQSMYFDLFLSYKVERRVIRGETDTLHSLNALSPQVEDLATFDILIEDTKYDYVIKHGGGLVTAGLAEVTRVELERQIRDKLLESYIYAMETKEHPNGAINKFNVMLEFSSVRGMPYRILASLEYQPSSKTLRLLTLH